MSLFSCKQELQLPWIYFEILNGRRRGREGMSHGAALALRPQSLQELQPNRPKLSNVKSEPSTEWTEGTWTNSKECDL